MASFISPTIEIREMAKSIIGEDKFHEIFINTPLSTCEVRDVKGLYKKARAGIIKNFTGIDAPYESPLGADLEIETDNISISEAAQQLFHFINNRIKY
jgi:adenylylsulfate kinase